MKKQSFITGAVILMTANAISKILGAMFKIPLTYIIHEEGMAVYNTAFSVYVMFLAFVISGIPFAVQKQTAAACAAGDRGKARETVRLATTILIVIGAAGTAVLWFGAEFFAAAMKEERAVATIRAIAPAVFPVACAAAVKSGFQGMSDMLPTAVSQVVESIIKLIAGYMLAVLLLGGGTEYAAAGAGAGVTVGEITATVMLVVWYMVSMRGTEKYIGSKKEIVQELADIAIPMMLISVTGAALAVCDTSVLRMSLLRSGLNDEAARITYGAYTGYALTVLNLPSGLLATLGVSVVPLISGAAAVEDKERIRAVTKRALYISFLCGAVAAAGTFFFGELALKILFHNTYSAQMIRIASPTVLFICMMQLMNAVLQSMGYIGRTFAVSITVAGIKILCSALLASKPTLGIYGTIIGTNIAYFAGTVWSGVLICRTVFGKEEKRCKKAHIQSTKAAEKSTK